MTSHHIISDDKDILEPNAQPGPMSSIFGLLTGGKLGKLEIEWLADKMIRYCTGGGGWEGIPLHWIINELHRHGNFGTMHVPVVSTPEDIVHWLLLLAQGGWIVVKHDGTSVYFTKKFLRVVGPVIEEYSKI